MGKNHVELLAPAGNQEGFYGAIHAGADAVYLGGSRFGARAYADNFTTSELISCIRYAHLWGRRVYLTVNTLVKESEFADIYGYLLPFYEAGLDGVIVQDIGVLAFIREHFPRLELHASTQMTLTGEYGARLVQDLGVCRIVPARELSLEEISHIKQKTGLSIETFIHGAMCYCYSGQCLFSSILGGRSGNRGRCAQPCRLPYEVTINEESRAEGYPLSLKDMCTIEFIPDLIEAGINSFKIEGRMKKPEYTAGVTAIYRKYIDKYYRDKENGDGGFEGKETASRRRMKISPEDRKELSGLYIRSQIQEGYYYKHNGRDMVTSDSPAYSGSDESLLARIRHDYLENKPKRTIAVRAEFITGRKARVVFSLDELSVSVEGDMVQEAARQPVNRENIEKQLTKLGDTSFVAGKTEITLSPNAFYSLGAMNELRREAVAQLENLLIQANGFPVCRRDAVQPTGKADSSAGGTGYHQIAVSVRRREQLLALCDMLSGESDLGEIQRIYPDCDLLINDWETVFPLCQTLAKHCEIIPALPYVLRRRDSRMMDTFLELSRTHSDIFSGALVRSPEGLGLLKYRGYSGKIYTDAGFYIWNKRTLKEWSGEISGFCLPLELRAAEQMDLTAEDIRCEKIIYGRIPMMIAANCIANTTTGCRRNAGEQLAELKDRYHKVFPVELNCTHCMNIIYNSVPLSLHRELRKWLPYVNFRLDFTTETGEETREVLNYFKRLSASGYGESLKPPYRDYTTGHEKRGVE